MNNIFEPNNNQYLDLKDIKIERHSNFNLFGIGKPSAKQIVKWEKKEPSKIDALIKKGVITKDDVNNANQKEGYTPPSNIVAEIPTLLFTNTLSFIEFIKNSKFDTATLQGISDTLSKVSDGIDNQLSPSEIAISVGQFLGRDINSADAGILSTIANDKISTDLIKALIANPITPTTTDVGDNVNNSTDTPVNNTLYKTINDMSTTQKVVTSALVLSVLTITTIFVVKQIRKHGHKVVTA